MLLLQLSLTGFIWCLHFFICVCVSCRFALFFLLLLNWHWLYTNTRAHAQAAHPHMNVCPLLHLLDQYFVVFVTFFSFVFSGNPKISLYKNLVSERKKKHFEAQYACDPTYKSFRYPQNSIWTLLLWRRAFIYIDISFERSMSLCFAESPHHRESGRPIDISCYFRSFFFRRRRRRLFSLCSCFISLLYSIQHKVYTFCVIIYMHAYIYHWSSYVCNTIVLYFSSLFILIVLYAIVTECIVYLIPTKIIRFLIRAKVSFACMCVCVCVCPFDTTTFTIFAFLSLPLLNA